MTNTLKKLKKENNNLQASIGSNNDCTVDQLLTEMDAARMGAVDREVVRRDLIVMVQEREALGNPIPMELDDQSREMCREIVANTGHRSRLEVQLYVVKCIAMCFLINDAMLLASLLGGTQLMQKVPPIMGTAMLLNIVWYYVVYLSYRQKCLFKKKARALTPLGVIGRIFFTIQALYLLGILFYPINNMIVMWNAIIYIGSIVDVILFLIARHSYEKYISLQCKQYSLCEV